MRYVIFFFSLMAAYLAGEAFKVRDLEKVSLYFFVVIFVWLNYFTLNGWKKSLDDHQLTLELWKESIEEFLSLTKGKNK